jgi:hypothetical protein
VVRTYNASSRINSEAEETRIPNSCKKNNELNYLFSREGILLIRLYPVIRSEEEAVQCTEINENFRISVRTSSGARRRRRRNSLHCVPIKNVACNMNFIIQATL